MKYLLFIIFLVLLLNLNSYSQTEDCNFNEYYFDIQKENFYFLNYYTYLNNFDSASVWYEIGEIILTHDEIEERIKLKPDSSLFYVPYIRGDSTNGEDSVLLNYGISNTFTLPDTAKVKFFRQIFVNGNPCLEIYDCNDPTGGTGTWEDHHWKIGPGKILDDTEFILQLVRDSDNSVISTIDSVGVLRNPHTCLAPRYGTNPTKMNHIRNLPAGNSGTVCYFRVSPRRNGPTPLGMTMSFEHSYFNRSAAYEYDSLDIFRCSNFENLSDSIDLKYFQQHLEYCDSLRLSGGKLMSEENIHLRYITFINDEHLFTYRNRYFRISHIDDGDTAWVEKDTVDFNKNPVWIVQDGRFIDVTDDVAHIEKMWPNPSPGGNLNLMIVSKENLPDISVSFNDLQGRKIESIQLGSIAKGENEFNLQLGDLNTSAYMLVLRGPKNAVIDTRKFIITE